MLEAGIAPTRSRWWRAGFESSLRLSGNGGGVSCPRFCWFWCGPRWCVAYVATRPDTYHVERTMTVAAPVATVFGVVDDLATWKEWSPWDKRDPAMKKTLTATTTGVGASYAWEGNKRLARAR